MNQMSINDILILIIALYGAVIATILGIREIQGEKRRISVVLEYVAFYECTQITIINIGHRPITITEIGMAENVNPNGKEYWQPVPRNAIFESLNEPFPATLTDGEHITLLLSNAVGPSFFMDNGRLAKVFVYDVEGNVYTKFKTRIYNPKWGIYDKKAGR